VSNPLENLMLTHRILILTFIFFGFVGCKQKQNLAAPLEFNGAAMGTTYSIKLDKAIPGIQYKVDSTLAVFNKIFSTYDSTSQISKVNFSKRDINMCFRYTIGIFRTIKYIQTGL
jgi:thiamine biosynthesis lipoprotein ApbE